MNKNTWSLSFPLWLSAEISLSENLSAFPDVAKKMGICYTTLANLFELLDDKEQLSEESFRLINQNIEQQIALLKLYLCDVLQNDIEVDRFHRMENYYQEIRMDSMSYLMSQTDENYYDINACLQKKFAVLSDTINAIDDRSSPKIFNTFVSQMKDIKDILESKKYEHQLTILQYQNRGKKYKAALDYVQKRFSDQ